MRIIEYLYLLFILIFLPVLVSAFFYNPILYYKSSLIDQNKYIFAFFYMIAILIGISYYFYKRKNVRR